MTAWIRLKELWYTVGITHMSSLFLISSAAISCVASSLKQKHLYQQGSCKLHTTNNVLAELNLFTNVVAILFSVISFRILKCYPIICS